MTENKNPDPWGFVVESARIPSLGSVKLPKPRPADYLDGPDRFPPEPETDLKVHSTASGSTFPWVPMLCALIGSFIGSVLTRMFG